MGKTSEALRIHVMMVGGRRCGKTSVLAAMKKCFTGALKDSSLVLNADDFEADEALSKKWQEMLRYFQKKESERTFSPNHQATPDIAHIPLHVGLKNKNSSICVDFVDVPGEWFTQKDFAGQLQQEMDKSRIVLIAIDTPHLMEAGGLYNEPLNRCSRVTSMLKTVKFASLEKGPGMVLFVPLKCERYYNEGRMEEVSEAVQKAYAELIQYLQQPGLAGMTAPVSIAVTPILTLGGAEFSRFERDEAGEIAEDPDGRPRRPLYHFPDMNVSGPEPKWCEMPMIYTLAFVFEVAKRQREQRGKGLFGSLWAWFEQSVLQWAGAKDYLTQAQAVGEKSKTRGDGYCLVSKGILHL